MMEEFATNYVIHGPLRLVFDGLLSFWAGGLASAIFPKSQLKITRAPYFFGSWLAYLLHSLHLLLWTNAPEAIEAGTAWMLMLESMVSWFAYGLVMGRLAAARSRDAYGHSQGAILAFIPVANLWLIFTRSRDPSAAMKPIWAMRGFVGVFLGISILLFGNFVSKYAIDKRIHAFFFDEKLPRDIYGQFLVNNIGLKDTLDFVFGGIKVPLDVDLTTTLVSVDIKESTVGFTYRVGLLGSMIGVSESWAKEKVCGAPISLPLLRAGVTFRHVVNDQNGRELATVTVTRQDCGL